MADTWATKDEWTPALNQLHRNLSPSQQRQALKDLGFWVVARVKKLMWSQRGFGTGKRYKKLRIKWRYHGRKGLAPTAKNLALARRAPRSAKILPGGGVSVVSKTKVDSTSRALIDQGHLRKSWDITTLRSDRVDVRPVDDGNASKACYNDDRGQWRWGRKAAEEAFELYERAIIEGVWT